MNTVDIDWLKTRVRYEPMECGSSLVWLVANGSSVHAGDIAGTYRKTNGRWEISLQGKLFQAHRVVWALMNGSFPAYHIDHKDRNPSNNRIENLRLATRNELDNGQNRSMNKNNTTGYMGVIRHGKRFVAQIKSEGKQFYLGVFDTAEEAHAAYREAKKRLHVFYGEEQ